MVGRAVFLLAIAGVAFWMYTHPNSEMSTTFRKHYDELKWDAQQGAQDVKREADEVARKIKQNAPKP